MISSNSPQQTFASKIHLSLDNFGLILTIRHAILFARRLFYKIYY